MLFLKPKKLETAMQQRKLFNNQKPKPKNQRNKLLWKEEERINKFSFGSPKPKLKSKKLK